MLQTSQVARSLGRIISTGKKVTGKKVTRPQSKQRKKSNCTERKTTPHSTPAEGNSVFRGKLDAEPVQQVSTTLQRRIATPAAGRAKTGMRRRRWSRVRALDDARERSVQLFYH